MKRTFFLFILAVVVIFPDMALANSSISEFTKPMELMIELLGGPVVRSIGILSLIICFGMLALQWSAMDDSMRKFLFIVIALSGAMSANKIIVSWFGFSGALIV